MTELAKKTGKGVAVTKDFVNRVRRQLADAFVFVRASETTQAISNITFNELIATAIKELVGDDGAGLRDTIKLYDGGKEVEIQVVKPKIFGRNVITKIDRINAIENTISGLIAALKKIDPAAIEKALASTDDSKDSSYYSAEDRS